jgi:hypothetical protein
MLAFGNELLVVCAAMLAFGDELLDLQVGLGEDDTD